MRVLQQLLKTKVLLSALLFVYTITVISRVPHGVLNEIAHRKSDLTHHHTTSGSEERAASVSVGEDTAFAALGEGLGLEEAEGGAVGAEVESQDATLEAVLPLGEFDLGSGEEEDGEDVDFDTREEYRNARLPAMRVAAVEPSHAPRAGGVPIMVRGTGFSAVTTSGREIGRKLQVTIGGVACGETRWISGEVLKCLVPGGAGTALEVAVRPCSCSNATGASPASFDAQSTATFSYTEDLLVGLAAMEPPLQLGGEGGVGLHAGQLVGEPGLEVVASDGWFGGGGAEGTCAISPEASRVLPRGDWPERHATCAVVGRSGSLWGSRLGQHIDRHEAVFRVDNAPSGSKFTQDVGKKVTYQVLDPNWAEALLGTASSGSPHVARWWMGTATVVLWSQRSQSQFVQLRYLYPDADILMLRPSIEVLVRSQVEHFASRLREAGLAGPESLGVAAERLGSLLPALAMASRVCDTVEVFGVFKRCGLHSRCRHTFFDDTSPTELDRPGLEVESKIVMALGAAGVVNTTTPVRMREDGTFVKNPSLRGPKPESGGLCDEVMCRTSNKRSEFQCTDNTKTATGEVESNSCRCEKTWGGRFCERDLLMLGRPKLASKVMHGIDLNYRGSLLMGRRDIEGRLVEDEDGGGGAAAGQAGFIELPEGTTRNRTVQGDRYELARGMFERLPADDESLFAFLPPGSIRTRSSSSRRKLDTCAVVGNSGSILHKPLGAEIDNHTMVYRFNQAPTAGYERYTGVKTTHESLNSAWVKALVDTAEEGGSGLAKGNAWRWRKPDTSLVLFEMFDVAGTLQKTKEQNANKDRWWKNNFATLRSRWPNKEVLPYNPLFVAWAYRKYGDLKRRFTQLDLGNFPGEKPMSGFYAVLFLLQVRFQDPIKGTSVSARTELTPYPSADLFVCIVDHNTVLREG